MLGAVEPLSDTYRELMLAEYKALRDESLKRMDHRITLVVSSLTVSSAILGFGVERRDGTLLLVTPVVSVLFGLLVLYHTRMIAEIARYLAAHVELVVNEQYMGAMGWNTNPDWRTNRFRGFPLLHLPLMLAVMAPTVVALVLAWQFEGEAGTKVSLAVLDGGLIAYYLYHFVRRFRK
jgi:hypothetical protein